MPQSLKPPSIIECIRHKQIFGSLPAFQSLDTWQAWLSWLKAIFAIPMTEDELAVYLQCTGRQEPPRTVPTEIYTICGRRGGKSFISSLTACFIACFSNFKRYLNAGERAAILILARDRDQAKIVFNYVSGILHAVHPLAAMIAVERADEIELDNDVIIMVKTSDYRAIRGLTVAAAILDEVAFWDSEGASPDREVLTALRPATSTIPGAKLIAISTPYSQSGALYDAHREHYGQDDEHVLVWQAHTRRMNPTIAETTIERELERDPEAGRAEWLAEFRTDLTSAFSLEALEACVIKGRDELPASALIQYKAFVDPSGGRADSFGLAIGHKERDKCLLDLLRAWKPPFDPALVVSEVAEILKRYGCLSVTGDRFAAEWPISSFRTHGIAYEQCEKVKSDLYLALIPTVNSTAIELLDNRQLLGELRRLERKRGRAGKDSVDHPPRLHDDMANAVAGLSSLLSAEAGQPSNGFNPTKHISEKELHPANAPVYIGITLSDPIASVIAQALDSGIQVFAAFASHGGLRAHIESYLRPWLMRYGRGSGIMGCYGDDVDTIAQQSLVPILEDNLRGEWWPPELPLEVRKEDVLALFSEVTPFTFAPKLQLSPAASLLASALGRSWDARDKSIYGALFNAFSLVVNRALPSRAAGPLKEIKVEMNFDPRRLSGHW